MSAVTPRASREASLDAELKPIIDACIQVRRRSRTLLLCGEQIALIAVNAGISASNSGRNRGVFIALANETKEIAAQIGQTVRQIQAVSLLLVSSAAPGVMRLRSMAKLREALPRIKDPGGARCLTLAVTQSGEGVRDLLEDIHGRVFKLKAQHQAIMVQIEKVEAIKVYFKIEASRDSAHGMYLDTIHLELGTLNETMERVAGDISDILAAYDVHHAALQGLTNA